MAAVRASFLGLPAGSFQPSPAPTKHVERYEEPFRPSRCHRRDTGAVLGRWCAPEGTVSDGAVPPL
jgi:hypothetical protein